jgi:hypothetical protein
MSRPPAGSAALDGITREMPGEGRGPLPAGDSRLSEVRENPLTAELNRVVPSIYEDRILFHDAPLLMPRERAPGLLQAGKDCGLSCRD